MLPAEPELIVPPAPRVSVVDSVVVMLPEPDSETDAMKDSPTLMFELLAASVSPRLRPTLPLSVLDWVVWLSVYVSISV